MDAARSLKVNSGDVIVARESYGFIERVTDINRTDTVTFVNTMLERCDENATWNTK
jgi:hypothetical protein